MPSDYKYVSEYWKKFLGYKKELESIGSFPEKNFYWIEMYSEWAENHRNKTGLELALSNITGLVLCHPDFLFDNSGSNFRIQLDPNRQMYVFTNERDRKCQMNMLNGEECIFNSYIELRGEMVGDHVWPHSLGGPSNDKNDIHRNRLILCENCNNTKSSSILLFDFFNPVDWLEDRLHKIYVRKSA